HLALLRLRLLLRFELPEGRGDAEHAGVRLQLLNFRDEELALLRPDVAQPRFQLAGNAERARGLHDDGLTERKAFDRASLGIDQLIELRIAGLDAAAREE